MNPNSPGVDPENRQSPRHAAAKELAGAGIGVFPCRVGAKEPATENGFEAATTNIALVDHWWGLADFNVGVVPASGGLCVIDADLHKGVEVAVLDSLPPTRMHLTPSGGRHYIYRSNQKFGNHKLARNVDVRSAAGYVLWPPSVVDGVEYSIDPTSLAVAQLPAEIARRLAGKREDAERVSIADDGADAMPTEAAIYCMELAFKGEHPGRYRLAAALVRNFGLSDATATQLCEAYGLRTWPNQSGTPWLQVLKHARKYGLGELGGGPAREDPRAQIPPFDPACFVKPEHAQQAASASVSKGEEKPAATSAETLILSPASPYESAEKYLELRCSTSEGFTRLIYYRGDFYVWTGTHYREMSEDTLKSDVYRFLDAARQRKTVDEKPTAFMPNTNKVNEVINALRARAIVDDQLSAPAWRPGGIGELWFPANQGIACRNGVLHWATQFLKHHTPELLTFNALNFDYDQNAPEPREWLKFLLSVWPDDEESVATLQEIFGYLVGGETRQQKAFLIVGPKRSGKGTIGRMLGALLGSDNVAGPTLASLAENFGLATLIGKRAAIISDARLGGRTDQHIIAERLLSISGEDTLTIDRKYREPWTGRLPVRFLVLSNELPRLADASGALSSRFILITMQRSFYGQEDLGLGDRLLQELPGILNWSLAGLERLNRRGHFIPPKSSAEALQELEDLTSPIGAFIREHCVIAPDKMAYVEEMYSRWQSWCSGNNRLPGTAQTFGRDLRAAVSGLTIVRPRGAESERKRVYRGIGLRDQLWSAMVRAEGTVND